MTHGAGLPLACRVVLDKLDPSQSRRDGLKSCGVMPLTDASVPKFVQNALEPDALRGTHLELPNIEQMVGATLLR